MNNDLTGYRKSYDKNKLEESLLPKNPLHLFKQWFTEVESAGGIVEPNAMSITTIGADLFPKTRVVLLKKFTENGFVFYTNFNSEKGKAIINNPKVCLSFFWANLERQVIIKGVAKKENETESTKYFNSRPRGSQIGAWASPQSKEIQSRNNLEKLEKEFLEKFDGKAVPKPPHWGGFIVNPMSIEFWQGRPNRLHDRILYFDPEKWKFKRLAP